VCLICVPPLRELENSLSSAILRALGLHRRNLHHLARRLGLR